MLPKDTGEVIGCGLGLCTCLRSLRCLGNHPTFTHRRWLPKFAPNLASTLTSLVISLHQPGFDLCHSLVGLSHTLESLEIREWHRDWREQPLPFHLPSAFPKLTELTLDGAYVPVEHVEKLFARIGGKKDEAVALRSLTIWDIPNLTEHIPALLSMNSLGTHLTALNFRSWRGNQLDSALVGRIVDLCPNLVDFAMIAPVVGNMLANLSHSSLMHLALLTWPDDRDQDQSFTPRDVAQFILSQQCCVISTITIFLYPSAPVEFLTPYSNIDEQVLLRSVCHELGARIRYQEHEYISIMFCNSF
ncbi:hypothetical protein Hypma_001664 [Hypsizygus marmoreus]|uniref:F-box domain-containing protein n=1 Tax=Hypsizygus marmoreus TaxID=39966 RepID=A0A369JD05_HYPMA|nr:hypothetical protein Hypma_001664 [Hypsizygus marmoreus]